MKTCATCQHWFSGGECLAIRDWNHDPADDRSATIRVEVTGIMTGEEDDGTYDESARLITGPHFGCVQHLPK